MIPISFPLVRSAPGQILVLAIFVPVFAGCWTSPKGELVVYSAQDEEFAAPILADFTAQTGIHVVAKYDVESTKTVGLAQAIIAEKKRPRCDLFWNNELLHTLRMQKAGLLATATPLRGSEYPEQYRASDGTWFGFAARARILLVNTNLVPADQRPTSVLDLAASKWHGQAAMAKPLFGTTATHAAGLYAQLGYDHGHEFFQNVQRNCQVLSGNKQVAQAVGRGEVAFGVTDTDDALAEVDDGKPVSIIFPDQADGQCGTLCIPNTLAIVQGSPHREAAEQLLGYLLSPKTEEKLAKGPSGQIPLHPQCAAKPRLELPSDLRKMDVDFSAVADAWEKVSADLQTIFAGG